MQSVHGFFQCGIEIAVLLEASGVFRMGFRARLRAFVQLYPAFFNCCGINDSGTEGGEPVVLLMIAVGGQRQPCVGVITAE